MVQLYTAAQREEVEQHLGVRERRLIGGGLWKWRYAGDAPCFAMATRPGGVPAWVSAVRTDVVVSGEVVPAAQVIGGDLARLSRDEAFDRQLFDALLDAQRDAGVKLVFGAVDPSEVPHLEALGFHALVEVGVRSLYLGLGLSRRMGQKKSLSPLRRIAQEAARIRTKLVEVDLDEDNLRRFAQAHGLRNREYSFAIHKTPEYLRWRYLEDPRKPHRFFVHRRRAGLGLDGLVVVRREESERGRVEAHVVDHWSREPGRRAHAVFLGEVVLWAMTEQSEVVRALAAAGSNVEQALIGMGGVRKKIERRLMLKRLVDTAPAPESLDPKKSALRAGDLELTSAITPPPRSTSGGGIFKSRD